MNLNENIYRIRQMMGLNESVSDIVSVLKVGSKGNEVSNLQKLLGIYEDGKFGPQTKKCVEDFQNEMGIKVDGIVGNETKGKLEKLEKGKVNYKSPQYCKTKIYTEPESEIESKTLEMGGDEESMYKTETTNDIIFMGGLEKSLSLSQQREILKSGLKSKTIIAHRYTELSKVIDSIKNNPDAYVVLFSAACAYASQVAGTIKNKNKLFIVEPYAKSSNTSRSVENAVSMGVPSENIIVGPNTSRGNGVVSGTRNTTSGNGHFDALKYVTNFIH